MQTSIRSLTILALVLAFASGGQALAQPTVDFQFGLTQAVGSRDRQPWSLGPTVGLGLGLPITERTQVRVGLTWRRLWDDTVSSRAVKLPHPGTRASRVWTATTVSAVVEHLLGGPERLSLFAGAGVGLSSWQIQTYPEYSTIKVPDGDGRPASYYANELATSLVFGMRPKIGSWGRLRVQFGIDYMPGIGADFADDINDERSRVQMTLGFGFVIPLERITATRSQEPDIIFALPVISSAATIPVAQAPASTASTKATETTGGRGDSDGDGVNDRDDHCPDTPIGAVVSRHGCPFDEDGDGVYDGIDRCPGTPADERALVDARGCPIPPVVDTSETVATETEAIPESGEIDSTTESSQAAATPEEDSAVATSAIPAVGPDTGTAKAVAPEQTPEVPAEASEAQPAAMTEPVPAGPDADHDGVPDDADQCPHTLRGARVDQTGCLVMTQLDRRLILHVSYLPGTTAPDKTSLSVLRDLVLRLKKVPDLKILVEGFTDNIGLEADNFAVSQKRADRIRAYLIKKGITPKRITAIGRGEARFIASNQTATGRQKNRRIEISYKRE